MDEHKRTVAARLRGVSAAEATEWLLIHYPLEAENWGDALTSIDHVSFPKKEAERLANYYLSRIPYASDRPYEVFAKLLGLRKLLSILGTFVPDDQRDRDLLFYHMRPLLDAAVSDKDRAAASAFAARISAQN